MIKVIAALLLQKEATLSSAESCTGGKVGSLITSMAGASQIYKGGVIAYDNKVKEEVLSVPAQLIDIYGAVSRQCVEAMASGVQRLMHTEYAVATSGIAGPEGGSEEKPVGTVWIAVASPQNVFSQKFIFSGNRITNIKQFSAAALNMLHLTLLSQ